MPDEDVAAAVYAGTSERSGVASLVVDRSELPDDVKVFVRAADPRLMRIWVKAVKSNAVIPSPPLSAGEGAVENHAASDLKGGGIEMTLRSPARLRIRGSSAEELVIYAGPGTHIDVLPGSRLASEGGPRLGLGRVQNKQVIFFNGGAPAIELPMRLAPDQYVPLILGVSRPADKRFDKELRASQRTGEGALSGGYSILV